MGYQGQDGLYTVFPTRGGSSSSSSSRGGRTARTTRPKAAKKAKARRPLKVGRTLPGYVKITSKNPLRAPTATETVLGALGARRILPAAARAARAATAAGGATLAETGLIPAAGILGTAGTLAYLLVSYGLGARDRKKLDLQEQAFRASQAYRAYREKLAGDQGRPLTKAQLKQTAQLYKSELLKLGLSSNDLKKIMGATIYDVGHPIISQ